MGEYDCETGKVKPVRMFACDAEKLLQEYIEKREIFHNRVIQRTPWLAEIVAAKVDADRQAIIRAMTGR